MINLYVVKLDEDDPKKCTAVRLKRFGFVKFIKRPTGLVLNPFSKITLKQNPHDSAIAILKGLTAVDASWNRSDSWGNNYLNRDSRRLPFLIAANPINFAKPEKLSTAEALAAALYILGFTDNAANILSKFKWGEEFMKLNKRALETYRTSDDILSAESYVVNHYSEIFKID